MTPPAASPPLWSVEELNDACFIVKDSAGQKLAYVYFEDEPGLRSAAKLLSKDEAREVKRRPPFGDLLSWDSGGGNLRSNEKLSEAS